VKHRLREALVNSHVGAVAIAVLLLWALNNAFRAVWGPVSRMGTPPQREEGKISPNPEDLPENRFKRVLACDPLMALRGSGKALWAGEHADDYVRRLRQDFW